MSSGGVSGGGVSGGMSGGTFGVDDLPVPALEVGGGVVLDVNALVGDEIGVDPLALLGRPLVDLVVADDRPELTAAIDTCRRDGGVQVVDVAFRVEGDRTRPVCLRLRCHSPEHVVVTLHDRAGYRRLNALLDVLADSTLVIDPAGVVTWQSDALAARIPSNRGDGIGVNPMERIHPEDLPKVLDSFARAVSSPGRRDSYVVRSRSPEDDDRWQVIELTGVSAVDHPDVGGVVVQVRNLADGEMVGSVGRADGHYQSLADAAPIGIVVDDRRGQTVYRNPAAQVLLGEVARLHSGRAWRAVAHPDYRAALDDMVTAALEREEAGNTIAAFAAGDRGTRWLRVRVAPHVADGPDADSAVAGVITTLEDVTAEVEARAETERLTHMLDATSDYVAVFRPSGEILYVNESTGLALDALARAGGTGALTDLVEERTRRAFLADVMSGMDEANIWRGELTINVAPDRQVPVSASAVARRDRHGDLEWVAMLARDISDLKEAEARLRQLATRDTLTGLANRALGNDRLELAVARHRRKAHGLAVLFCDLDGFKAINDLHGHAAGDQVLVQVAERLSAVTRAADTVARVGGDEFLVVCEGSTDRDRIAELAERVIGVVSEPIDLGDGHHVSVGISVGVALTEAPIDALDADRLLIQADTAMYQAKARGGSQYRVVTASA
jgi:diguanylate cyclase (GGDEF)-like protein/PAS domain S-box-containing protein